MALLGGFHERSPKNTRRFHRCAPCNAALLALVTVFCMRHHCVKSVSLVFGFPFTLLTRPRREAPQHLLDMSRVRHICHFFGPSNDELQSKLDGYISEVDSYTEREVACMPTKWRALVLGIKAGLKLPSLLKAVRLLYADVLPLRVGGDFIMKGISSSIQEGKENTKITIPDADLVLASALFEKLDVDGSGRISEENLRAIGLTSSAISELMEAVDTDGNREIDLFEFMADKVGDDAPDIFDHLGHHLVSADLADGMDPKDLNGIVSKIRSEIDTSGYSSASRHEARFDQILRFILDLEQKLEDKPIPSGRMQTILAGSFEAAKDIQVVSALRFVYCEVAPLRLAGDLVYGIVTKFVR
eukprot:TRINITY_DN79437_c0_g1_i1.p1 TRINITY_DN79437_c0_g1~~TRINITY_DN79437_c0_g1_i1.p1  ORF type:complete len:358 (-),score=63.64 TRINITY_DN79437_c0_g1_i1:158-1231(-)